MLYFRHKLFTWVIAVDIHGEGGQLYKVDAVAFFYSSHVGIAKGNAYDVADAGIIAGSRSHPQYVVVAPLYVPRVVTAQCVHDDMGSGTSVVDISEYMELVYHQALYDVTDGNDEVIGRTCGDDGVNDGIDIFAFVLVVGAFMQEFLNDVREVFRKVFPNFRPCVFAGYVAANQHKMVNGHVIPVVDVVFVRLDQFELLFWIVDERTQFVLFGFA